MKDLEIKDELGDVVYFQDKVEDEHLSMTAFDGAGYEFGIKISEQQADLIIKHLQAVFNMPKVFQLEVTGDLYQTQGEIVTVTSRPSVKITPQIRILE